MSPSGLLTHALRAAPAALVLFAAACAPAGTPPSAGPDAGADPTAAPTAGPTADPTADAATDPREGSPARSAVVGGLDLAPCSAAGPEVEARCGTLTVYEDRRTASGRTIDLDVVVVPAASGDPAPDPVFFLSGGPGQASTDLAPAVPGFFGEIHRDRDIVLIDQRGTGDSNPLRCDPATLQELLDALAFDVGGAGGAAAAACREGLDADVRHYTTPVAMDDLDDVRAALGYERIDLFGGSYGTRAALVYMRRHPERVRSAVLRGVADTGFRLPLHFPRDAQTSLDSIGAACARADICPTEGSLGESVERILARLDEEPARVRAGFPGSGEEEAALLTADGFSGGFRLLLYGTPFSRAIPAVVRAAEAGDFGPFLDIVIPLGSQLADQISFGMFLSVVCTEDLPRIEESDARVAAADTWLGTRVYDRLREACAGWVPGDLPEGFHDPVRSDAPVLIVSGSEDPVTPPLWGEAAARHLPNAVHVVVPRTGHLPTFPGCVSELVARFLDEGSGARLDLSCVDAVERPPFVGEAG